MLFNAKFAYLKFVYKISSHIQKMLPFICSTLKKKI